ncbi:MFS transporter [Leifsonia aquatica]|uniref:MFS transporter n=1 Tax=Leifsonia aquatica TaxID=144185 RepID=UPI0028AB1A19|nr:MFS transporter [Leifsonia aquatica]
MSTSTSPATSSPADPRRWAILIVIAVCQLMLVLDSSIVTIALPQAQQELGISDPNRQWIVTAYALAFGGLLLLGGRIADSAGRKRVFVIGLVGFAVASALGGLAPNAAVLFGARALQGAFAAIMAPAALSLLAVTFTKGKERATAFSVYGGISGGGAALGLILGGGAALGLILGGVLTEFTSWRWCLLVNVPVALVTAIFAARVIKESRSPGRAHYDIPGAITVTLGLVALVYGFSEAGTNGWAAASTIIPLAAAGLLLVAFVIIETRVDNPLLPLRVVLERNRAGAFIAGLLSAAGLYGMFLFLTYYLQGNLHYSALQAGFAFLPFSIGIVVGSVITNRLLPRIGPRIVMTAGMTLAALGLFYFTGITPTDTYFTNVLPAEIIVSIGMGIVFVTVSSTALLGVRDSDSGTASALVNTSQQVGGSLGTALLNTIAATATVGFTASHTVSTELSALHGYQIAFLTAGIILAVGALATLLLVNTRTMTSSTNRAPGAPAVMESVGSTEDEPIHPK